MAIGKTNAGGGGTSLNFDVKRYPTETELLAATPAENTIGIISITEMTGWIIDANQPEDLTEGMVWISAGASSAVEFNALKKNGIQVYPTAAKQYVRGALVNVPAMIFTKGEWKDWAFYLYHNGDLHTSVTGWDVMSLAAVQSQGYVNVGEECISFTAGIRSNGWCTTLHCPLPAIDLTKYKTVTVDIEFAVQVNDAGAGSSTRGNGVCVLQSSQSFDSAVIKHVATSEARQTVTLPVESLSDAYYIGLFVTGAGINASNTGYCYEIRFD